ncbi:hypothetical protein CYMTET_51271 [Cymbomonas tetramitiformis]|uniref:Uncharacterized protein n=1 Tax=Cymbomonas tetramitiformis TaxID=36881 RepID=A0AAE0ESU2_9CHLO|nr:hypothetical protein CYMTET_51271 [Cymbomonas tetramitiformis]
MKADERGWGAVPGTGPALQLVMAKGRAYNYKNVYVSIYESGSDDMSGVAISAFQQHLNELDVPHQVGIQREGRHRIDFLALLRNLALKPLYQSNQTYDWVVYLNDVYVRAVDVLTMIDTSKREDAHMACGVDFQLAKKGEITFYDIWVHIDLHGKHFRNRAPYVGHPQSWEKWTKLEPFQVFSCWGGVATIKAELFQKHGIRFRGGFPLECSASECELIGRDLWASNQSRIIVVPSVMSAYTHNDYVKLRLEMENEHGIGGQIRSAAKSPQEWTSVVFQMEAPGEVDCCSLDDMQQDMVDLSRCMKDRCKQVPGWSHRPCG